MSTDRASTEALEQRVTTFLGQNFPQIQMHGGDATVCDLDPEQGTVRILLAGACSGCGISPMTIQAIKSRLPADVPELDEVIVETGTVETESSDTDAGHDSMGGHPAGGGVNLDYDGDVPDWRKDD